MVESYRVLKSTWKRFENVFRELQDEMRLNESCEHDWVDIGPYYICAMCKKRRAKDGRGNKGRDKEAEV